ncbi:hypothetical protein N0V95_009759 [Ascochyta clinopodiicola]|nr:hypothetical protein N0V95_009759 [Ascochyta clinopodiicola]
MAAYMYTSATGNNWDDDDENFDTNTYKSTADFSAPTIDDLGPLQCAPAVAYEEYEVEQLTAPVPRKSTVDNASIPRYHWPSPARATAELWNKDEHRRPAYMEMSHDGGYAYPDRRNNYNTNWLRTKVNMCYSMKVPTMMKPSPLQQSMTWDEDDECEYIKDASLLFASTSSPPLSQGGHSEDGQDGPFTPPDSPSMVIVSEWKGKAEEVSGSDEISDFMLIDTNQYDPATSAIDITTNFEEKDAVEISHEFIDFNYISEDLHISDIIGDDTQHLYYDQTGKQSEEEVDKPKSNLTSDSLVSYTPPGTPSLSNANEEVMCNNPTALSNAGEDGGCIRRDSMVDLITVNAMAQSLITIVKATEAEYEIVDVSIEDATTKTLVANSRIEGDVLDVHNKAFGLVGFVKTAQVTVDVNTTAVGTVDTVIVDAESHIDHDAEDSDQFQDDNSHYTSTIGDSTPLVKTHYPSPDLKYIHDPSNDSLVWNTVAASWFAISSVPWSHVAVATAGALVDVVAFVARR